MKRILFNDFFQLTKAVLERNKTMTRRAVPQRVIDDAIAAQSHGIDYMDYILVNAQYKVGEEVAIAQAYKDLPIASKMIPFPVSSGWNNKMFVKAEYMPHRIRITDVRVEHLQDITESECMYEGVEYTCGGKFNVGDRIIGFHSRKAAFARLIDKLSGKGTWDSNPLVYAYTFTLVC